MIRDRFWRKLAIKGLEKYYKKSGGDAIGLVAEPGQQLDYVPVKYKPAEECTDDGDRPGWHAKDRDKVWEAGSEGRVVDHLGRTPIVALHSDDHVEAGWLRPRIGEAIELDRYQPVFANAELTPVFGLDVDANPGVNGQQPAVADGGASLNITPDDFQGFEVSDPGVYSGDSLIDLRSNSGFDGMRVSFAKAHNWQQETADTEKMETQEKLGYLQGKMAGENGPSVFKLLLLCAAIILGVLGIVFIAPQLFGGGGGGSTMPSIQLAGAFLGVV